MAVGQELCRWSWQFQCCELEIGRKTILVYKEYQVPDQYHIQDEKECIGEKRKSCSSGLLEISDSAKNISADIFLDNNS